MVEYTLLLADLTAVLTLATMYAILSLGLSVQWGYAGLFNAGVAAFWAIGAYSAALLSTGPSPYNPLGYLRTFGGFDQYFPVVGGFHTSILVGLAVAILLAAFVAFLIAIPTLRLRADYLAIATLGLAEIIRIFLLGLEPITGGVFGIFGVPKPLNFDQVYLTNLALFLVAVGLLAVLFIILQRTMRSPWGRLLKATREDERAAVVMGKDTYKLKLQAFVLGAAVMGAAGWVFAHFASRISPDFTFVPLDTFLVWIMVVIGGSGNHRGALLGAFLIFGSDALLRRSVLLTPSLDLLTSILLYGYLLILGVLALYYFLGTRRPSWKLVAGLSSLPWVAILFVFYGPALGERIFFLRLMLVGLLLIVLVLYRPEGILKESKQISKEPRIRVGET